MYTCLRIVVIHSICYANKACGPCSKAIMPTTWQCRIVETSWRIAANKGEVTITAHFKWRVSTYRFFINNNNTLCTHTYTHKKTQTNIKKHTLTRASARTIHTYSHSHSYTHTCMHACTHKHFPQSTYTHARTHPPPHTHLTIICVFIYAFFRYLCFFSLSPKTYVK